MKKSLASLFACLLLISSSAKAEVINLSSNVDTTWTLAAVQTGGHGSQYAVGNLGNFKDSSLYSNLDFTKAVARTNGGSFNVPFAPITDGVNITGEVTGYNFGWANGSWITSAQPSLTVTEETYGQYKSQYVDPKVSGLISWLEGCDQGYRDAYFTGRVDGVPALEGYKTSETKLINTVTVGGTTYTADAGYNDSPLMGIRLSALNGDQGDINWYTNNGYALLSDEAADAIIAAGGQAEGLGSRNIWFAGWMCKTETTPGTTLSEASVLYAAQLGGEYDANYSNLTFDGFDYNGVYAYKTVFDAIAGVYNVGFEASLMYDDNIVGLSLNGVWMDFTSDINQSGVNAWREVVGLSGLFSSTELYATGNELIFVIANNQQDFYDESYFMNPTGWAGSMTLTLDEVPEPATLVMLGLAAIGLPMVRRFRKK